MLDLQGVPQDNGVGEQTEATGLVHIMSKVGGRNSPWSAKLPSGQAMTALATVQLGLDAQAERLVM